MQLTNKMQLTFSHLDYLDFNLLRIMRVESRDSGGSLDKGAGGTTDTSCKVIRCVAKTDLQK